MQEVIVSNNFQNVNVTTKLAFSHKMIMYDNFWTAKKLCNYIYKQKTIGFAMTKLPNVGFHTL